MPIYVYRAAADGCDMCRMGLEILQRMDEDPVVSCPHCGGPVERVPAGFAMGGPATLSSQNLKDHGFRKLQRTDEGGYRDIT